MINIQEAQTVVNAWRRAKWNSSNIVSHHGQQMYIEFIFTRLCRHRYIYNVCNRRLSWSVDKFGKNLAPLLSILRVSKIQS